MSSPEQLHLDLPQWQKELIDTRLEQYILTPTDLLDWDIIAAEFDNEDEVPLIRING